MNVGRLRIYAGILSSLACLLLWHYWKIEKVRSESYKNGYYAAEVDYKNLVQEEQKRVVAHASQIRQIQKEIQSIVASISADDCFLQRWPEDITRAVNIELR